MLIKRFCRRSKIYRIRFALVLGIVLVMIYISRMKVQREGKKSAILEFDKEILIIEEKPEEHFLVAQKDEEKSSEELNEDEDDDNKFPVFKTLRKLLRGKQNFIFETDAFPKNESEIPFLTNGHLGYRVYGNAVYVNGIYSGTGPDSHRAWIPNYANIRIYHCEYGKQLENNCQWKLNIRDGVFMEHILEKRFELFHLTYPHRKHQNIIVNQIFVKRLTGNGTISINMQHLVGTEEDDEGHRIIPDDILIEKEEIREPEDMMTKIIMKFGKPKGVEKGVFGVSDDIKIMHNEIPQEFMLKPFENFKSETYLMSVSYVYDGSADYQFDEMCNMDSLEILGEHTKEWNKFWDESPSVVVPENDQLTSIIQSAIFTLASSIPILPVAIDYFTPLTPGKGHITTDTDIWVANALNFINTNYSRKILTRRSLQLPHARINAASTGYKGARYPVVTDNIGYELDSDFMNKLHVTADVGFALRHHHSMTRDDFWLKNGGCSMSKDIARFWASVATFNENTGFYEINNVTGPDSKFSGVNNDIYTNVAAGFSLFFGRFTECYCSKIQENYDFNETESKNFDKIGSLLTHPYNKQDNHHLKNSDFNLDDIELFGVPDVLMLNYPLEYRMNPKLIQNDDTLYAPLVDLEDTPTFTHVIHAMVSLSQGTAAEADEDFRSSFINSISYPFYLWTSNDEMRNYLVSAGAFLQLVFSGYAGVRPRIDALIIKKPHFLPNSINEKTEFNNLDYLGNKYRISVNGSNAWLTFTKVLKEKALMVKTAGENDLKRVEKNRKYEIPKQGLKIRLVENRLYGCEGPLDVIGQKTEGSKEEKGSLVAPLPPDNQKDEKNDKNYKIVEHEEVPNHLQNNEENKDNEPKKDLDDENHIENDDKIIDIDPVKDFDDKNDEENKDFGPNGRFDDENEEKGNNSEPKEGLIDENEADSKNVGPNGDFDDENDKERKDFGPNGGFDDENDEKSNNSEPKGAFDDEIDKERKDFGPNGGFDDENDEKSNNSKPNGAFEEENEVDSKNFDPKDGFDAENDTAEKYSKENMIKNDDDKYFEDTHKQKMEFEDMVPDGK